MPTLHFAGELKLNEKRVLETRGARHLKYLQGLQARVQRETPSDIVVTHDVHLIYGSDDPNPLKTDVFYVNSTRLPEERLGYYVSGDGYFASARTAGKPDRLWAHRQNRKDRQKAADSLIEAAKAYSAGIRAVLAQQVRVQQQQDATDSRSPLL